MASAQLLDIGMKKTNNNPSVGANNQKGKKKHEVPSSPSGSGSKGSDLQLPGSNISKGKTSVVDVNNNTACSSQSGSKALSIKNVPSDSVDILSVLKAIQANQNTQNAKFESLASKVDEMYYCDDGNTGYNKDDDLLAAEYEDDPNNYEGLDDTLLEPDYKRPRLDVDSEIPPSSETRVSRFSQAGKKLRVKDKCDVPVNDELASLVDGWFREGIEEDRYFELIKTIARPENCTSLVNIKTNQLVWEFLAASTKIADKKIQNAQTSLVKGAIILTKLTDVLGYAPNEGSDENLEKALEALALLGHTNKQLCFIRRENMKPDIKGEYSHLCSQTLKYTDHLFGDDVSKTVKDISDCSRISNKISQGRGFSNNRARSARGRGFRGRFSRGHFRGRGFGASSSNYGASKNFQKRGQGHPSPSQNKT
ncbi:hypothetical protein LOTGIDRAFT_157121 [Lottia gigantea]|uniref:Uncharacterized protein n=1 Tax=Lottia gigantea TaxID=225164 RepID=V4CIJ2_LOTGI|nr:hypothetical protein LOTGIDRAFT_157121 [Lottia gigantea]ESP01985.1 hypothetical protein LOTGIDRAFT_157121 [Lottia gigantea]